MLMLQYTYISIMYFLALSHEQQYQENNGF